MSITQAEIDDLNAQLADASPKAIMAAVIDRFPRTALAFSGAEDVLLVHFAARMEPRPAVFTLDTGRLHAETYEFLNKVRSEYSLGLEILSPDSTALEEMVLAKGLFSFYQDGHQECCGIRKVAPLRRRLATTDAWVTGQRRDQSPSRVHVPLLELDPANAPSGQPLVKVNPLANWSLAQVWDTIRMLEVPYNPLHDRGFVSIGCEPCTRAIAPGQHEREGRWWWEEATIRECGLHGSNLSRNPDPER